MASNTLRVLIVTDVRLYREGLEQMLARDGGVEVVGTAAPGDVAIATLADAHPHVVLVDSTTVLDDVVGDRLRQLAAGARIVAFAVAEEDDNQILACARAGVSGFVPRDASVADLTSVMRAAIEGQAPCPPRITASLIRRVAALATPQAPPAESARLTAREQQVVRCIDAGLSNKEIAGQLGIAVVTVKNHVHNILGKLSLHRRGEAAARLRARPGGSAGHALHRVGI